MSTTFPLRFTSTASGRCLLINLVALGIAAFLPVTAQAGIGLDRLTHFFDGLRSIDTGFEQTVNNGPERQIQHTRGRLQIMRPGRFRWTYEDPYEQLIVTNGTTLWVYDPDLAQVTVSKLDASIGNTPALLLSTEQPLENVFRITESTTQDGLAWLDLEPKQTDANFTRLRLAFDRDTLRVMEVIDSFGQTMQIRFIGLHRNPAMNPAGFEYTPPAGVDIVGGGE